MDPRDVQYLLDHIVLYNAPDGQDVTTEHTLFVWRFTDVDDPTVTYEVQLRKKHPAK